MRCTCPPFCEKCGEGNCDCTCTKEEIATYRKEKLQKKEAEKIERARHADNCNLYLNDYRAVAKGCDCGVAKP